MPLSLSGVYCPRQSSNKSSAQKLSLSRSLFSLSVSINLSFYHLSFSFSLSISLSFYLSLSLSVSPSCRGSNTVQIETTCLLVTEAHLPRVSSILSQAPRSSRKRPHVRTPLPSPLRLMAQLSLVELQSPHTYWCEGNMRVRPPKPDGATQSYHATRTISFSGCLIGTTVSQSSGARRAQMFSAPFGAMRSACSSTPLAICVSPSEWFQGKQPPALSIVTCCACDTPD